MLAQSALFHLHELRDTTVRVCQHVSQQRHRVLHVIRGGDGSWLFLCGRDHTRDHHEGIAIPLKEMIKADPTLNAISALAPHDFAKRPAADEPWVQGDQLALEIPACIEKHGWFVALVSDDSLGIAKHFAYTIGMPTSHGHAELIIMGQPADRMPNLLNTLGSRIARGRVFHGETKEQDAIGSMSIRCKAVHPTWYRDYLGYGLWYHGSEDFEVMQVFWPDEQGLFPWDPDCGSEVVKLQPDLSLPKQ